MAHIHVSKFPVKSILHILYQVESREPVLSFNSTARQHSVCARPSSCFVGRCQTKDFIIAPNLWLLNMSDFSSVDYRILAMLQEWVCQNSIRGISISWGNVWLTDRRSVIKRWWWIGPISRWHELWPEIDILNIRHSPMFYYCTTLLVHTFLYLLLLNVFDDAPVCRHVKDESWALIVGVTLCGVWFKCWRR